MNEFSTQITKLFFGFVFLQDLENAGVYLAVCVLILCEILGKVAHQTSYRSMWAAEDMLHLQAWCKKDIQSGWVKESQKCVFVSFL